MMDDNNPTGAMIGLAALAFVVGIFIGAIWAANSGDDYGRGRLQAAREACALVASGSWLESHDLCIDRDGKIVRVLR
jgi:hypothetical protein